MQCLDDADHARRLQEIKQTFYNDEEFEKLWWLQKRALVSEGLELIDKQERMCAEKVKYMKPEDSQGSVPLKTRVGMTLHEADAFKKALLVWWEDSKITIYIFVVVAVVVALLCICCCCCRRKKSSRRHVPYPY